MERLAPADLSALLLFALAWARLGLAVQNERLRQRAAEAVAARIVRALAPDPILDPDQLSLAL